MTNEEQILQNTEEILTILKNEFNITEEEEETNETNETQYITQLNEQLQNNTHPEVIEWIINQLQEQQIYSEEDIIIKIFTDKTGDTILEIKIRPYPKWGKIITYFYENIGEPFLIETSKYSMRLIIWYKLTHHMQHTTEDDGSSIIDKVTTEWGNKDDINAQG